MSTSKVRRLLTNTLMAELVDAAGDPEYLVLVNGIDAEVDDVEQTHLIVHILPAPTYSDTLSGDHKSFTGLYQMMVRADARSNGMLKAEIVADRLQEIFYINRRIGDTETFVVQVTSPLTVSEGKEGPEGSEWWEVACRIAYRADTN